MKRLFLALRSSTDFRKKVLQWRSRYENLPARWMRDDNIHITLIPPWYSKEAIDIDSALQKLRKNHRPFSIRFHRIQYGPDPRRPRLVWIEGSPTKEILALKQSVESALGIAPEKRLFIPHVTLARIGKQNAKHTKRVPVTTKITWEDTFTAFYLIESKLRRDGAQYEVVETYAFKNTSLLQ